MAQAQVEGWVQASRLVSHLNLGQSNEGGTGREQGKREGSEASTDRFRPTLEDTHDTIGSETARACPKSD